MSNPDPEGLILALHSTSGMSGVALMRGQAVLDEEYMEGGRSAIRLTEPTARMLGRVRQGNAQIRSIAVATGPGSFTGIKVGLATAFGLSRSLGVGITGICSLEVLADQADPAGEIAVMLPAGRGDVYLGEYGPRRDEGRPVNAEPVLLGPPEAAGRVRGKSVIHIGCEELLEELDAGAVQAGDVRQLTKNLGWLAAFKEPSAPDQVPAPLYLRRTWAEENRRQAATGGGKQG